MRLGEFTDLRFQTGYQPVGVENAPEENLESVAEELRAQTMARRAKGELLIHERPNLPSVMPALPTMYTADNQINYPAQEALMRQLVRQGIRGFVVMGTTGESALVSFEEHKAIVAHAVAFTNQLSKEINNEHIYVVAGGANATGEQSDLIQTARRDGADASLLSVPYYLRPQTEANLLKHLWHGLGEGPGIIYRVQARTGIETSDEVIRHLSTHPNFLGVKECDEGVGNLVDMFENHADHTDLKVWSGEDGEVERDRNLGAYGSISVTANIFSELVQAVNAEGRVPWNQLEASRYLSRVMFRYGNPMTIHNATEMGRDYEGSRGFRSPVLALRHEQRTWLIPALEKVGVTDLTNFSDNNAINFFTNHE